MNINITTNARCLNFYVSIYAYDGHVAFTGHFSCIESACVAIKFHLRTFDHLKYGNIKGYVGKGMFQLGVGRECLKGD